MKIPIGTTWIKVTNMYGSSREYEWKSSSFEGQGQFKSNMFMQDLVSKGQEKLWIHIRPLNHIDLTPYAC
jgi:hypothetical protein